MIVAPEYCDCAGFAQRFKNDGFSVADIKSNQISRLWNTIETPCIIYGNVDSVPDAAQFPGMYTCVYLYPNKSQDYIKRIRDFIQNGAKPDAKISELRVLMLSDDDEFKSRFVAFCTATIENNRNMYKKYCDYFDNKFLTVLL
jgi:hypothetical protein